MNIAQDSAAPSAAPMWPANPLLDRQAVPAYMPRISRRRIIVEPGYLQSDIRWNQMEQFIRKQDEHQPILLMQERFHVLAAELSRRNGWDLELFSMPTSTWTKEGQELVWYRMFEECTHLIVVPSAGDVNLDIVRYRDTNYPAVKAKIFR